MDVRSSSTTRERGGSNTRSRCLPTATTAACHEVCINSRVVSGPAIVNLVFVRVTEPRCVVEVS